MHSIKGKKYIDDFSSAIQGIKLDDHFNQSVDLVVNCNGKIVTTGIGKAGAAMRKFSSLLCSLGFVSCYLHPGEASHGDLGILESNDVLFVASTSGKTREIIEIIDLANVIGVKNIIGITSHYDSPIRNKVNVCIDMGEIKEAGELGLAPTTSILVMLAITDAIALIASESKGLTKENYAKFHHQGYLGSVARGEIKGF